MKLKRLLFALLTPVLLWGGCKYDDDDVWTELDKQAVRIAALEQWKETINGNITALQGLVSALESRDHVTAVIEFTNPSPGGYRITFAKSGEITIWNGAKGDKGDDGQAPQIGIKQYTDEKYYWTLDGEWLLDADDKMVSTGVDGTNGTNGNTPKVRINAATNMWEISADGSDDGYISTGVKATGDKGATGAQGDAIFKKDGIDYTTSNDWVEFTLSEGGKKIKLPKYKELGISFTPPLIYKAGQSEKIAYTVPADKAAPTNIRVVGLPAGWKATVAYGANAGEITITPPAVFTGDNFIGEATVLVGDDYRVATMLALNVIGKYTGPASNNVGSLYYQDGVAVGIVFRVKAGDDVGTRGLVASLDEENVAAFGPAAVLGAATNQTDGLANMELITGQTDWETKYPAFKSIDEKNNDLGNYDTGMRNVWYLPSAGELQHLLCAAAGKDLETWYFTGSDEPTKSLPSFNLNEDPLDLSALNDLIGMAGGALLEGASSPYYWSSSKPSDSSAYYVNFETGKTNGLSPGQSFRVRAILAF